MREYIMTEQFQSPPQLSALPLSYWAQRDGTMGSLLH